MYSEKKPHGFPLVFPGSGDPDHPAMVRRLCQGERDHWSHRAAPLDDHGGICRLRNAKKAPDRSFLGRSRCFPYWASFSARIRAVRRLFRVSAIKESETAGETNGFRKNRSPADAEALSAQKKRRESKAPCTASRTSPEAWQSPITKKLLSGQQPRNFHASWLRGFMPTAMSTVSAGISHFSPVSVFSAITLVSLISRSFHPSSRRT